jgi:hypothetical protein
MNPKYEVCRIDYHIGRQPWVFYTLYAKDKYSAITTLTRSIYSSNNVGKRVTNSYIEVELSAEQAEQFHIWLSWFPEPQRLNMDISPGEWRSDVKNYSVTLHEPYGEKWYSLGWGNLSFRLSRHSYDQWEDNVNQLIGSFEELTGNLNQVRPRLEEAIESYNQIFHKHGKYNIYQRCWNVPTSTYGYYYTYYRSYWYDFLTEDISDDHLRQLDYRHYLVGFLWLVAFQDVHLKLSERIDSLVVFQKIGETDVNSWEIDEQEALHNYFRALWEYILVYCPSLGIDAYTFVHGVGLAGVDVTPYIEHWKQEFHRVEVSRHLAGYVRTLFEHYVQDGVSIFDTVPKILRRWLKEVAMGSYFLKQFVEYDGNHPFAQEFADASEALDVLCAAGL